MHSYRILGLWLTAAIAMFFWGSSSAQEVRFDVAIFTPPAGWQSNRQGDVLQLDAYNTSGDSGHIALLADSPNVGTPANNFASEWRRLVVAQFRVITKPYVEKRAYTNDWTALSTEARVEDESGRAFLLNLRVVSGHGRVMSILVATHGDGFNKMALDFLKRIRFADLSPPPNPAVAIVGDWILSARGAGLFIRFEPNGRYTEVVTASNGYQEVRKGSYTLAGNEFTLRGSKTSYFRIERRIYDYSAPPEVALCSLDSPKGPSSDACYKKLSRSR